MEDFLTKILQNCIAKKLNYKFFLLEKVSF